MTYRTPFIFTSGTALTRLADNAATEWPDGLVNDFVISCDCRPIALTPCTILESGDVKLSWATDVLTFAKGLITATIPLTIVSGQKYVVQGRLNTDLGIDVFADSVKGTGAMDVTDAAPSSVLQIGADEW